MHFLSLAIISYVLSSVFAAPMATSPATTTVQLANDQTGANANVAVPVDGSTYLVKDLWGSSSVASGGVVFASSAQLVAFGTNTICTFTDKPSLQVSLDTKKTSASFSPTYFSSLSTVSCVSSSVSTTSKAHSPTDATVQLSNDQTGANANINIPVDGQKYAVQELWGSSALAPKGLVFASSAQLVAFGQNTVCTFTRDSETLLLNAQTTWGSFGSVMDLCGAEISCKSK
ncbi:hypothetical protein N7495_005921 [Penicillium taxi]|uniref:uncharacterized protein n=1 Tax=Penicillium taxi TaxID=168475 RepID=UPI0025459FDC|nr:uncharacterized protein N7495_005921 [Penicillium taxi]KAJ5894230.1 hypothetical protein N7495_005921 [Penicillium taxi]